MMVVRWKFTVLHGEIGWLHVKILFEDQQKEKNMSNNDEQHAINSKYSGQIQILQYGNTNFNSYLWLSFVLGFFVCVY